MGRRDRAIVQTGTEGSPVLVADSLNLRDAEAALVRDAVKHAETLPPNFSQLQRPGLALVDLAHGPPSGEQGPEAPNSRHHCPLPVPQDWALVRLAHHRRVGHGVRRSSSGTSSMLIAMRASLVSSRSRMSSSRVCKAGSPAKAASVRRT